MMNYDLVLALAFYLVLYLLFRKYRSRFDVQNKFFVMYKTQLGIRLMERIARSFPRVLHVLGFVSVVTGFLGMGFIFFILFQGTFNLVRTPTAQPVLAPILPGVSIPCVPALSFWHWIIGILIIAVVHEFMHGVYAKLQKIKIKSSGFAFLGPILAAFVEPDEDELKKLKKYKQLTIISAGPFANFVLALLVFVVIVFVFNPVGNVLVAAEGVQIVSIDETLPINETMLRPGMRILGIDERQVNNPREFSEALGKYKPGDIVLVKTNVSEVGVVLGASQDDPKRAMLGVSISPVGVGVKKEHAWFKPVYPAFSWLLKLAFWLFTISLGVGLFNLLPLGPIDGGRMFMIAALWLTKNNERKARRLWMCATLLCLMLIFINLLPYLVKLLQFIFGPLVVLVAVLF